MQFVHAADLHLSSAATEKNYCLDVLKEIGETASLVAILFLVNGKRIAAILPLAVATALFIFVRLYFRTNISKNLFVWMQVCALVLLLVSASIYLIRRYVSG